MSVELKKEAVIFAVGSIAYPAMEMLWRGYTHLSMAVAGGLSLLLINKLCCNKLKANRLFTKCVVGSAIITGIEFLSGIVVNKIFLLNVWDYSDVPYNVFGQICLPFSVIWFFISIPAVFLCEKLNKIKFKEKAKTELKEMSPVK